MTYDINIRNKIYKLIITKKKIKRIIIRVNYKNEILLSSPINLSYYDAIKYVFSNSNWIEKTFQKYERIYNEMSLSDYFSKKIIFIQGQKYYLINDKNIKENFLIVDDKIYYKKNIEKTIEIIYSNYYYLIEAKFNQVYKAFKSYIKQTPKLVIRKMKSRWGSCNYKTGNININKMLVCVPNNLLYYVIVHEFSHLLYPNHSKNFYDFLKKIISNHKELEKELKKYAFLLN